MTGTDSNPRQVSLRSPMDCCNTHRKIYYLISMKSRMCHTLATSLQNFSCRMGLETVLKRKKFHFQHNLHRTCCRKGSEVTPPACPAVPAPVSFLLTFPRARGRSGGIRKVTAHSNRDKFVRSHKGKVISQQPN